MHELSARLMNDVTTWNRVKRVAVIGDSMLDKYRICKVLGQTQEDELAPKLQVLESYDRAGGAANVAVNLQMLMTNVRLFSVSGTDPEATQLSATNNVPSHMEELQGRPTTVKLRYITEKGRHIARIDREVVTPITPVCVHALITNITAFAPELIVVSDYAKGVVTPEMMNAIRLTDIPFIVDPKGDNYIKYERAKVIKPNIQEIEPFLVPCAYPALPRHPSALLITTGATGAHDGLIANKTIAVYKERFYDTNTRPHGDPTGCGDSALAGLALGILLGWELHDSFRLAMATAACTCDHIGVYAPCIDDVKKELDSFNY